METTELAKGRLTKGAGLSVLLRESDSKPAAVHIVWPAEPTAVATHQFPTTVARAMTILARASVRLTQIRRGPEALT
jgi:hypothetical protein